MNKRLNIAVFTDSFFPGSGGTEVATYQLCKTLKDNGHNILLFAPDYHKDYTTKEFEVVRVKSVPITKNDMVAFPNLDSNKIKTKLDNFQPDIFYFCTVSGMAKCAIKYAKKMHKPVVSTVHTKFKDAFYDSCHSHLITSCLVHSMVSKLNKADRVVTVGYNMRDELAKYGYRGDVLVINNGTDHLKKIESTDQKVFDSSNFKFLFAGRLVRVKNIQFSLHALGLLKREKGFVNFRFYIVGAGPYKKKLQHIAKNENVLDNIVFTGFIGDPKELAKMYANCDLLLFPSTFDNDSLVVLEAGQNHTPALVLANTGASERIIDNQTGFVSDNNLSAYAERIYKIVNDKALLKQVSNNTTNLIGQSWHQVALEYEKIFRELINSKN